MSVNTTLSRELAEIVEAQSKQCYRNAVMALGTGHARLAGAVYVEGWVIQAKLPIPIEHGWVELADGSVIDPTLCLIDDDATLQGSRYVAGKRFTEDEALTLAVRGPLPLHSQNGYAITRSKEWQAAMREAYGPMFP